MQLRTEYKNIMTYLQTTVAAIFVTVLLAHAGKTQIA